MTQKKSKDVKEQGVPFQVVDLKSSILNKDNKEVIETIIEIVDLISNERKKNYKLNENGISSQNLSDSEMSKMLKGTTGMYIMAAKLERNDDGSVNTNGKNNAIVFGNLIKGEEIVSLHLKGLQSVYENMPRDNQVLLATCLKELGEGLLSKLSGNGGGHQCNGDH